MSRGHPVVALILAIAMQEDTSPRSPGSPDELVNGSEALYFE